MIKLVFWLGFISFEYIYLFMVKEKPSYFLSSHKLLEKRLVVCHLGPRRPLEFHADIFFAWTQRDGGIKDIEKPFRNHSSPGDRAQTRELSGGRVQEGGKKAEKSLIEEDKRSYKHLEIT